MFFPMLYRLLAERTHFFMCVTHPEEELNTLSIQGFSCSSSFHWTINIQYSRWSFFFLCLIIPAICTWESASPTRLSDRSSTRLSGRHCHPVTHHELTAFLAESANAFETIRMWKNTAPHSIPLSKYISGMECCLFSDIFAIYTLQKPLEKSVHHS